MGRVGAFAGVGDAEIFGGASNGCVALKRPSLLSGEIGPSAPVPGFNAPVPAGFVAVVDG